MKLRYALLALALGWGIPALARLDVPPLTSRVVDRAGVFEPDERARLDETLGRFERARGPQIFVLTLRSLEGEPIESFSLRVAEKWRPGQKKEDNGIIVVVAIRDRKVRIEVGQGLEGDLPDVIAGRIIRETMAPHFRAERYRDGLLAGLQEIALRLGGRLESGGPSPHFTVDATSPVRAHHLLFFFLLLFILLPRLLGRGHRRPGGFWTGMVIGSLLGGGRGRSGGDTFGGFGGGGGGGFSGGGASGDW